MQDRFKFRVFSTTNKRYTDIGLSTALAANSVSNNQFVIQQSIGVKDKLGRLIYEGDQEFKWNELEVIASIADNKLLDLEGNMISTLTIVEDTLKLLNLV